LVETQTGFHVYRVQTKTSSTNLANRTRGGFTYWFWNMTAAEEKKNMLRLMWTTSER